MSVTDSEHTKNNNAGFDSAGILEKGDVAAPTNNVVIDEHTGERLTHKEHKHRRLHLHRRRREHKQLASKLPAFLHTDEGDVEEMRKRLEIKNEIIAAVAEFCGTFLFLLFSFGVATIAGQQQLTASSTSQVQGAADSSPSLNSSQLLYSSLGFGFSLAVNAWIFFRVSGGLFNPAVTLGLYLAGAVTWYRAIILTIVQYASAIAAAGIGQLITPGGINVRTRLGGATTVAQGVFIELFCTSLLMFAIYMLAGEKHKATFLAPVGIGLALFLSELWATGLTGGSLNPARSLGPDVIAAEFDGSAWIYYVGPYAGATLAFLLYWLLKFFNYQTAVEGQDGDDIHLLVRDKEGNLTGFVEQVAAVEVPDVVKMAPEERPIGTPRAATPVASQFDPDELDAIHAEEKRLEKEEEEQAMREKPAVPHDGSSAHPEIVLQ
ncbi:Aquaporin-1 [Tilletia horrida]|uniref:Aquaporin-1 n=1 Tax=Tilletia horrida TaxID=155126 RepID=A0AAN6GU23_9BASI|nr:Aquaporin-1 [Tilletia horrida]KAK0569060.1 Aquaporin-1 [Tilletia horrida]